MTLIDSTEPMLDDVDTAPVKKQKEKKKTVAVQLLDGVVKKT